MAQAAFWTSSALLVAKKLSATALPQQSFPLQGRVRRLYAEMYPKVDVLVMPSLADHVCFTDEEALSFGLPVIASRLGSIAEVIDHELTGFLVSPGDRPAVSFATERFAAGRGRPFGCLRSFSIERFQAEVGRIYREALGS